VEKQQRQGLAIRLIRRVWPWLVGSAILVVIATRIPLASFRAELGHGPHLLLAAVDFAVTTLVLCTDSFATWIGLIVLRMRRPLAKVFVVRGATYLLYVINYALGQGGFGYYLHRSGATSLRAVGATLFLMGTNLATLLVVTSITLAVHGSGTAPGAMVWTLIAACIGFAFYLSVIASAPRFLVRRQVLEPLFDAGLRGHAVAMIGRIPHMALVVLGNWVAMRAWGIPVPFGVAITIMPVVAIISVLPISPAGLGTTQVAMVYFFSTYASGITADDRAAGVLAFAIVHFVYGVLACVVIGLVCTPFAKRGGDLPGIAADVA
jgi:hypothetical protein